MKRTALVRHTPLRARRLYRPPAPRESMADQMPGLWDYIVNRDKDCVARQLDPDHACEGRTTVDHVPDPNRKGLGMRREIAAPHDRWHLVRLCWGANVNGWASANRDRERDWIAMKEGPAPDG